MKTHDALLPSTVSRVEENTADKINARLRRTSFEHVMMVAEGDSETIATRLEELDREWDVERVLEMNASLVILGTLTLGWFHSPWWLALTAVVPAFLLLHALQGWCPPLPILRRLGFRTEHEIHIERTALRILRGDFRTATTDPIEAQLMAERQMPFHPSY